MRGVTAYLISIARRFGQLPVVFPGISAAFLITHMTPVLSIGALFAGLALVRGLVPPAAA
jgi:hypothetical protein